MNGQQEQKVETYPDSSYVQTERELFFLQYITMISRNVVHTPHAVTIQNEDGSVNFFPNAS